MRAPVGVTACIFALTAGAAEHATGPLKSLLDVVAYRPFATAQPASGAGVLGGTNGWGY